MGIMNYKKIIVVLLVFILVGSVYGCEENPKKPINHGETQSSEALVTETQQAIHLKTTPPPKLDYSLERANLIRRLNFLNAEDRMLYVALFSNDGKLLNTYVTHKVSSVNSMLTTPDQIVPDPYRYSGQGGYSYGQVVASPDLDGSYGDNGAAIFFFTTDGQYVEWNGMYLQSSAPFTITTPPVLVQNNK
jgi:hypothetical protein